jgi:hypothetical protein
LEGNFFLESGFHGKYISEKYIIFLCLVVLWKMSLKIFSSIWLFYGKWVKKQLIYVLFVFQIY